MPDTWAFIPFDDTRIKELKQTVTAIPQLMVMDKDGRVLRENARNDVFKEGAGALRTWVDY